MQVVITSRGAYLHEKDGLFEVRTPERSVELSPAKVSSIVIGAAATLSTGSIRLAVENNIDILFLDEFGDPFARAWHCGFGSIAAIRRKQMEWAISETGGAWIVDQIADKLDQQKALLEELLRRRPEGREAHASTVSELAALAEALRGVEGCPETIREKVFALEARGGKLYFECLAEIVPAKWRFQGRSRRPAKDAFNAFLNYGYGVLYGLIDRAAVLAGLDPHLGLLHTDGYGRPSLVFDLIEPYRPWVDRVVVMLFSMRRVNQEMLRPVTGGFALDKPGKAVLLEELNGQLDANVRMDSRQRTRRNHVQMRFHRMANRLLGKGDREREVSEL